MTDNRRNHYISENTLTEISGYLGDPGACGACLCCPCRMCMSYMEGSVLR